MVSQTTLILGSQVVSGLVLFVTTPFITLGLGSEEYGLYTLLFLLVSYCLALDFGLSFALVKHVAEHDPVTERATIDGLVNTVTGLYAVIVLIFGIALVLARDWVVRDVLHVADDLVPVARDATVLVACALPFTTASTVFNALFRGLLRLEYVALFSVVNVSGYSVGAALLIAGGRSLLTVMSWYLFVAAASAFAQWAALRRLLPGFLPLPRFDARRLRQLFGFGGFMAFNQVGRIALLQLDRLVIGRVLSTSMVSFYAVPFSISQRLSVIGGAAATVAFPHSSASASRGQFEVFRRQHLESARLVAWLTLAPTLSVIAFAHQILQYWISLDFAEHGTMPLQFLAFGVFWISIAYLYTVSIEGTGRPRATAVFTAIAGLANIGGLLTLTPTWGLEGAAASVASSLVILAALNIWYCNRVVLAAPLRSWLWAVIAPTVATAVLSLPVLVLLRGAVTSLASLLGVASAGTAFTCLVGQRFFLKPAERRWVRTRLVTLWAPK